jgi:hypothetical protein
MEDCCDTCIRIKEDLDSPHVSAADKEILKAYQFKHIADSMSMRTVMRDVIERFAGCKLTDTLSVLSDEALLSDLLEKVHLIPTSNEDALGELVTCKTKKYIYTKLRFTYSDWINELFSEDYKHMFYSDSHFYQGPEYSSLYLRQQFRVAFSDLVTNLCKKLFGM